MKQICRFAVFIAIIAAPVASAQTPAAAPASKPAAPSSATPATTEVPAAKRGTVNFIIKPWGEVLIGGKPYGVSPPMKAVLLPPGKHVVVIRNTGHPDYTEAIEVKAGEQNNIRHSFGDAPPPVKAK